MHHRVLTPSPARRFIPILSIVKIYSASQEKRKLINQIYFSEKHNDLSNKFTLLQNSVYPLSFDTSYKMYWSFHGRVRTILNGDVKIDLRRIGS